LLPVLHLRVATAHAAVLAAHDERVDLRDLHAEELLDRALDLDLVGVARDFEDHGVVVTKKARLLGEDDGTTNDFLGAHFAPALTAPPLSLSWPFLARRRCSSAFAASCERTR